MALIVLWTMLKNLWNCLNKDKNIMRALYFAYGSNMYTARLRARITYARIIGPAFLEGWQVVFNKRGIDDSGKANLVKARGSIAWGVLYETTMLGLDILDRIEGGYRRVNITVKRPNGDEVEAATYISGLLTKDARPYKWYKDLVITGAIEHGLPEDYIEYLKKWPLKNKEALQSLNRSPSDI